MPTELAPQYDPTAVEPRILEKYLASKVYAASPDAQGDPYSIVIPPPNVTAALHLGHALNNTIQDVLTRYHRMRGFNTLWMPGTDHAGIATQTVVDKRLQQEGKPALKEYKQQELDGKDGRGQFIARVTAWKDEYEQTITNQLKEMGCSCDWDRQRFTMDDQCAKAVREAFFQLFKDGLIYRGKRLVNWDPMSQTALADDEVEMQDIDGNFYYMMYPICDAEGNETGEFATVATTRPETMLGDTAVAVNPNDTSRVKYIGQFVKLPIVNRIIPIIGDDYVVIPHADAEPGAVASGEAPGTEQEKIDPKAKMASGFLKVTPAHDPNDYEIGTRHDLAIINVMAPDASISIDHGWPFEEKPAENAELQKIVGLSREEARKQIVIWFKEHDLMGEVKPYRHAVGHSYRSHVPIEPYYTDQWYVKVTDDRLKGEVLRAMAESQRQASEDSAFTNSNADSTGGTGVPPVTSTLNIHKRNLPHWQLGGSTYFVTFRLRKGQLPEEARQLVLDACLHWHDERMQVFLATVMPDHVHLLIKPLQKQDGSFYSLQELLQSIKSFTAHELNKKYKRSGPVWQEEYFDRIVRDDHEFLEKWQYMLNNPLKAGLVDRPEEYAFTTRGDSAVPADHGRDARATVQSSGDAGLTFTPARYAKTFQTWHENIRDWCISRQLWWGHRIPVWSKAFELAIPEGPADSPGMPVGEELVSADGQESEWATLGCADRSTSTGPYSVQQYVCVPPVEGEKSIIEKLEAAGFTQDPDVLDTWFSSALWPLSTMGWPDDTPELAKWNPTSVLCTAREIITLWVSRMVMFNRYFKGGDLPFKDVFIHAMIQDGHGQKMSKSLGNGVDPMDIIHSHGADAMRYTLTKMTTHTQDVRLPVDMVDPHTGETFTPEYVTASGGVKVAAPIQERNGKKMVSSYGIASGKEKATDDMPAARNTSEKFDEGQRFANKLWNAFRFALSNLGQLEASPQMKSVGLAERWILHRLGVTIESVDKAIREYRFSDYATAVYDFVWRDLCDWYIEIVKKTLAETPAQQQVLVTCLDASLRLLHPSMPFITERLWEALNEQVPTDWRGVEGLELKPSEMLINASWPKVGEALRDDEAQQQLETLRSIVEAVRNARNAYKIPPKQKIEATTKAPAALSKLIFETRYITGPLTNCIGRGVGPAIDRPAGAAAVIIGDVTVYLHDVIDVETEKTRLDKMLGDKQSQLKTFDARLSNDKYVNNAPAHLVQETRDQRAAVAAEIKQIEKQVSELG